MSKKTLLLSFPTIDQCVEYLVSIGCQWSYEKECILKSEKSFEYEDYLVVYDPHNILG